MPPCRRGISTCRTILCLQSTTRHKSLDPIVASKIASELFRLTGGKVTIINGPGEKPEFDSLESRIPEKTIRSPAEFLEICHRSCTVVSVDSGLRHLAAFAKIPRIVIYGPTSPRICGSGMGEIPVLPEASCTECGNTEICTFFKPYSCLSETTGIIEKVTREWQMLHQK
ncbi:glycosyltransferase family 9 protein [Corynebacterium meridianum]|uniref:glycosyltransferase family 9 protein n=2 Tax=Corynebacterium TaxID=1716 RepID=UPI003D0132DB